MSGSRKNPPAKPPEAPAKSPQPPEPQPTLITATGVPIIVREPPSTNEVDESDPPDEPDLWPPVPHAIIVPENQPAKDRAAFIKWLEDQWGPLIDKELARYQNLAPPSREDLRQDVLLILCNFHDQQRAQGKPVVPEHVPAFLKTFVGHAANNHVRKKGRRPAIEDGADVDEVLAAAPSPEQTVLLAQLRDKLASYRRRLPPVEKRVFALREDDQLTFEQIAELVQLPTTTVFQMHARATNKIKDMAAASERGSTLAGSLENLAHKVRCRFRK